MNGRMSGFPDEDPDFGAPGGRPQGMGGFEGMEDDLGEFGGEDDLGDDYGGPPPGGPGGRGRFPRGGMSDIGPMMGGRRMDGMGDMDGMTPRMPRPGLMGRKGGGQGPKRRGGPRPDRMPKPYRQGGPPPQFDNPDPFGNDMVMAGGRGPGPQADDGWLDDEGCEFPSRTEPNPFGH